MRPVVSETPLVSVVMAVYDGAQFIAEAIASVLAQSHGRLELIVVDDGSRDATAAIVRGLMADDRRVRLIERAHQGHAAALNAGVQAAAGEFIARIDHDDRWRGDKLSRQLAFMRQAGVDVCGSWARRFGAETGVIRFACSHEAIRYEALFTSPILDSATVFRADLLRAHPYPAEAFVRQELLQCVQLVDKARFANLPRYLCDYRAHPAQKTRRFAPMIRHRQQALGSRHFRTLFPHASGEDVALFERLLDSGARPLNAEELGAAARLFVRYLTSAHAEVALRMKRRWRWLCRSSAAPRRMREAILRETIAAL